MPFGRGCAGRFHQWVDRCGHGACGNGKEWRRHRADDAGTQGQLFRPTRPGLVIAEAWVERHGKRTSFYEGHFKDAQGTVLAKATSTILLADMTRVVEASRKATAGEVT